MHAQCHTQMRTHARMHTQNACTPQMEHDPQLYNYFEGYAHTQSHKYTLTHTHTHTHTMCVQCVYTTDGAGPSAAQLLLRPRAHTQTHAHTQNVCTP
jgi:hypothetical protein